MSRIKKISVTNLKAISELEVDFNGCTAIITAGNNKGKTSFLTVFTDRLKNVIPAELLKEGTKSGGSTIELDNGEKFIWEVGTKNKVGEKLTYVTKDDIRFPLTAAIAKKYFPSSFDVDKFLLKSPKEQNKDLQKLIGLDLTDIDNKYKAAFDDRTFKNRKKIEAGDLLDFDKDLPTDHYITDVLEKEILSVDSYNTKINGVIERSLLLEEDIIKNEGEITRLQEVINSLYKANEEISAKLKAGQEWLKLPANQLITPEVVAEKNNKLSEISIKNEKIIENNRRISKNLEITELTKSWQDADDLVKKIEKERTQLIKKSKLPEGFDFTEDGINYNGKPFSKEQLSTSSIYIGALKLAHMGIGEVKTIHFDASYLDKFSLSEVESWANSNDLQLLIERPDIEGGEITYELRTS